MAVKLFVGSLSFSTSSERLRETFAQIGTAGANATTFADTTAQPGTDYYYQVRAADSGAVGISSLQYVLGVVRA